MLKTGSVALTILMATSLNAFGQQFQKEDVTIPVPGNLGQAGILRVNGTPGAGQDDGISVAFCEADALGKVVQFGCKDLVNYKLNQDLQLSPGTYLLMYSSTQTYVRVAANQTAVVNLQKINIPAGRNVTFDVFVDYTSLAMQELLLENMWNNNANKDVVKTYCGSKDKLARAACNALKSTDAKNLRNTLVSFKADGSYSVLQAMVDDTTPFTWYPPQRDKVTDPKAGDFVSVIAGVYGITFTDPQTGKSVTQYGIQVN